VARRRLRHLVIDQSRFGWSISHAHERGDEATGGPRDCREIVRFQREGSRGRLDVVFRAGPGRVVPVHAGGVGRATGQVLNLNEPGAARAVLDEAISRGWRPDAPVRTELDGWALFDAALARRASRSHPDHPTADPGIPTAAPGIPTADTVVPAAAGHTTATTPGRRSEAPRRAPG
jgi:hypothetical protein